MITVDTTKMNPTVTFNGVELSQLRAICRKVGTLREGPLSDIAIGFCNLLNGSCEIAQTEVPVKEA